MSSDQYERISHHPEFHTLVKQRSRLAWSLSAVVLIMYFAFILLIAFAPHVLGIPINPDSPITIGIPVGIGIIVMAFILTGVYVRKANQEFDQLTRKITEETQE